MNFNRNKITYLKKNGCLIIALCSIQWFIFLSFWPPLLWGAMTFPILFFFTIFNMPYVPIGGVQVLFKHQKTIEHPFGSCLPWTFKCSITRQFTYVVATQFATKKQLKDLTHMSFLWIPCHKLYKEGVLSYVFTLKYTCHFEMSSKNINPKGKIKNK